MGFSTNVAIRAIEKGFNNVVQEFYNDTTPLPIFGATNSSGNSRRATMLASGSANNAVVGNLSSGTGPTNSTTSPNSNSPGSSGNGGTGSSGSGPNFGNTNT